MHDFPNISIYDDINLYDPSSFNIPLDYTHHNDLHSIILFSFDEGAGTEISQYEYSHNDSPKISKWIFNLMCINDHKRLK